ncbi:sporulation protein [Bacillus thuringiensis serovar iberica]|uniref:Sporulation protein n=1 Tax=Bacillus thuringiensis serovar iberica TaxID=180866 RepID=A0A9X6LLB3_BACTU|nr:NucA/NucB deoxyribonuclease domain-containing protein [Bacillus thuringiensis]MEB9621482.1 NucA/NucB deoxyribonuclease domain-containing protein [Bacillus cereus]OUB49594.1 sporulation protein [Bacillus thuringiensis serovar iberica]
MKIRTIMSNLAIISVLLVGCKPTFETSSQKVKEANGSERVEQVLEFPSAKYPETGAHIKEAIEKGKTDICTIDRKGAADRRKQSLANVPTKKGYDRDEYPMALCQEGGVGADIKYIKPSDNRGAGSYIGNKVEKLPDGAKVKIVVK